MRMRSLHEHWELRRDVEFTERGSQMSMVFSVCWQNWWLYEIVLCLDNGNEQRHKIWEHLGQVDWHSG